MTLKFQNKYRHQQFASQQQVLSTMEAKKVPVTVKSVAAASGSTSSV
jgi:hypothetical protein